MDRAIDSSSDEDDPYANSALRLRALKRQRLEREKLSAKMEKLSPIKITKDFDVEFEQQTNGKEIDIVDGIKTRSMAIRGRRNRDNTTYATIRQTRRGRRPPINLECEVEIISIERKPELILESCNNDVVALSDDDAYSEDDNYEINIKILWRSNRMDRLSMHRYDSFQKIFQHYADLEKVSVNEVLIMQKDKIIKHTDTPVSLKLSVIDILDGGIVNPGMNALSENKSNDDDDTCTIKVQTANKKQSLTIPLKRDQRFKMLLARCAEQLDVKESSLKLFFDGEQIDPTDTPESLDIEGEACVDLHISA